MKLDNKIEAEVSKQLINTGRTILVTDIPRLFTYVRNQVECNGHTLSVAVSNGLAFYCEVRS